MKIRLSPLSLLYRRPLIPKMSPPFLVVLDFDSTLTTSSTLPAFLSIPTAVWKGSADVATKAPATAEELGELYGRDIASHTIPSSFPRKSLPRRSLSEEIGKQDSLRPVEVASFRRGCEAFRSVRVSDAHIRDAARRAVECGEVKLRKGWQSAVMSVCEKDGEQQQTAKVCVLSVAWSPVWIRGVLDAAARQDESRLSRSQRLTLLDLIEGMEIRCNDVLDPPTQSDQGIYVSSDKLRTMNQLQLQLSVTTRHKKEDPSIWTIFVGDSPTDLECLFAADVSIIIRDEATMGSEQMALRDCLRDLDIAPFWIGDFGEVQTREEKAFWWARDSEEIVNSGSLDVGGKIFPSQLSREL